MHLHDDHGAAGQRHAGTGGDRGARLAGHPGSEPRRVHEVCPFPRQPGSAEAAPPLACGCAVPVSRCGRGHAGLAEEDHVMDDRRRSRLDLHRRHELVLAELRLEDKAVVVVGCAVGRTRDVGDRHLQRQRPGGPRRLWRRPRDRLSERGAMCNPGGDRGELEARELPRRLSDVFRRVRPGRPGRHDPLAGDEGDRGGVRHRVPGRGQRERRDAAGPVAAGALVEQDRQDVARGSRYRCSRPAVANAVATARQAAITQPRPSQRTGAGYRSSVVA